MKCWPVMCRTRSGQSERTLGIFPTIEEAADFVRTQTVAYDDGSPISERPALFLGDPVEVHGVRLE